MWQTSASDYQLTFSSFQERSDRTEQGEGRVGTNTYIHVYIQIHIYMYIYICVIPPVYSQYRVVNFSSDFAIKREDWSICNYRRKGCFSYLLAILGWKVEDCSLHHRKKAKGLIIWFVLLRSLSRIILCCWRGRWFTTLKAHVRELETK